MFEVVSRSGSYGVEESASAGAAVAEALRAARGRAFVLLDARVAELHPEVVTAAEGAGPAGVLRVEARESAKSYAAIEPVITAVIESGLKRDGTLVVVGGGVLQDIGCFVASVLFRGIAWSLVPTTLLAQCDSCIGSKSSVNVGRHKNQLGTFHAPSRVYLAFDLLKTLPRDEIRSGIGEIIKLHIVAGPAELEGLRARLDAYLATGEGLGGMALDALAIKKGFIEEDEFDTGRRNLLNYGHTFAHAYESATNYGIPHGVAVSLGVSTATYFSERLGMAPAGSADEIDGLLRDWYEPFDRVLLAADPAAILAALRLDKKNTGGAVRFILTRGPGALEKVALEPEPQTSRLLADYLTRLASRADP